MHADFAKRIVKPLTSLECQIVWFAFSPPEQQCGERLRVAHCYLALLDGAVDEDVKLSTPYKIALLLRDRLLDV
eukprot:11311166-Alexandrium_andersonii.AAC.1